MLVYRRQQTHVIRRRTLKNPETHGYVISKLRRVDFEGRQPAKLELEVRNLASRKQEPRESSGLEDVLINTAPNPS